MSSTDQKMPTLGYFSKIISDCLGLWSSEKKDISFTVSATEKARRKALADAFNAIKRSNGKYGSHSDLIAQTTKIYPKPQQKILKNKTIQDYLNYLSKEDFSSYHEFLEFKEYIDIVISDRHEKKALSMFATNIYASSAMYYKEFVREHAISPEMPLNSYVHFIKYILIDLIASLARTSFKSTESLSYGFIDYKSCQWPLRTFVDSMIGLCNVSLQKLHQFHEVRLNNAVLSDEEIWNSDLKANSINTKSKQVIDRLSKNNRIKWNGFFSTIKPLVSLLPEDIDEDSFIVTAYSAYVIHNLMCHLRELNFEEPTNNSSLQEWHYPGIAGENNFIPLSEQIDLLLNMDVQPNTIVVNNTIYSYHELIRWMRRLNTSLIGELPFPSLLEFSYSKHLMAFPFDIMLHQQVKVPVWLSEWNFAKHAVASNNGDYALQHYKKSLNAAKYVAGSLFIFLYVDICAFCKRAYQEFKRENKEYLFDRFYESLGGDAAKYATLLGYTSGSARDPETLMPRLRAPVKDTLLRQKIDSMV
ncbi:hypothetical protein ACEUAK_09965 [Aeromonas veronii]